MNDNYGHASGDALLRVLAVLLGASATEPGDIIKDATSSVIIASAGDGSAFAESRLVH